MIVRGFSLPAVASLLLLTGACERTVPVEKHSFAESHVQPAGEALRLQGRVNDAAGLLDADAERRIATRLEALEKTTGHQMVVVTTASLGGESIFDYALSLARRWGIGRKGMNDGVVVLVAPNERQVRIAVGYGLEKALPDPFCKQVIDSEMLPRFKRNDFAGGLEQGIARLVAKIG